MLQLPFFPFLLFSCPTGEARITPGFRLKAKHVVRAAFQLVWIVPHSIARRS